MSDRATLRPSPVASPVPSPVLSPAVPLRTPEVRPEVKEQLEKSPEVLRSPTPPVPEQIDLPWTRLASEALDKEKVLSSGPKGSREAKKLRLGRALGSIGPRT